MQGIFLLAFTAEEQARIQNWLSEVESSLPVTGITVDGTLREVIERAFESPATIVAEQPANEGQIVFFSGLNGKEMVGLAEMWSDFTGPYQQDKEVFNLL
jgi:hypothetical protein